MKNIYVNGRFLCRRPTGVDRFATELLRVVDNWYGAQAPELDGLAFEIFVPDRRSLSWMPDHLPVTEVKPFRGHLWEQRTLAARSAEGVLLSLCNTGPVLHQRHIVAVHDITPIRVPASFSWSFRTLYRFLIPAVVRTAKKIVTVSEFSRTEIANCYGIALCNIHVVYNSAQQILRAPPDNSVLAKLGLGSQPFVLAVATKAKHKNLVALLSVADQLAARGIRIVLVGGGNERVFGGDLPGDNRTVLEAGYITDGQLRALYEGALCLVFPSLYEGFGIPPLEAMSVGCPVISSNVSAMPEVLGDAALYITPSDSAGLIKAVTRLQSDETTRRLYVSRGLARSKMYDWQNSARELLDICRNAFVK